MKFRLLGIAAWLAAGCSAGGIAVDNEVVATTASTSVAVVPNASSIPEPAPSVDDLGSAAPTTPSEPPPVLETNGIRVTSEEMPEEFNPDGDLAEWGAVEGVALALDSKRVAVAGTVPRTTTEVYIAFQGLHNDPPPLGLAGRGGGVTYYGCGEELSSDPAEAREQKACLELEKANERFAAAVNASFQRVYRIDTRGVFSIGRSGKAKQVQDAKASFAPAGDALTFEVELTPKELPRLTQAPLWSIGFGVSTNGALKIPLPRGATVVLGLMPVGFEPDAGALEMVFGEVSPVPHDFAPLLSYQPGEGGLIQEIGFKDWFDRDTWTVRTHQAFQPVHKAKKFEIGWTFIGHKAAAVRSARGYTLLDMPAEPVAVVSRGKDVHIIALQFVQDDGYFCRFGLAVVQPDGSIGDLGLEPPFMDSFSKRVTPFHSADYTTFGCAGPSLHEPGATTKAIYRWDAVEKAYLLTDE